MVEGLAAAKTGDGNMDVALLPWSDPSSFTNAGKKAGAVQLAREKKGA